MYVLLHLYIMYIHMSIHIMYNYLISSNIVYVYIYVYIYVNMYIYIYTYVYIYIHIYVCVWVGASHANVVQWTSSVNDLFGLNGWTHFCEASICRSNVWSSVPLGFLGPGLVQQELDDDRSDREIVMFNIVQWSPGMGMNIPSTLVKSLRKVG